MASASPDMRAVPFRTMVALGESNTAGAGASTESARWVSIVADQIGRFQGAPLALHNKGIGANAISPRSPGYPRSAKPSALERYREDVIALRPDLFILSYGLNDMRAGMPPEDFGQDMTKIIVDVQAARGPVVVLTTVYRMTLYDLYPPFNLASRDTVEVYNLVIRQLAEAHGCILADIWAAQGEASWTVHPDTVHANDLGHRLIGNRVFEAIATHCSGVATTVTEQLAEAKAEVERTMDERRKPQDYG